MRLAHYVIPMAHGFPALDEREQKESAWHKDTTDATPRRREFIKAAKTFGAKYRDAIRAGCRKELEGGVDGLELVFEE